MTVVVIDDHNGLCGKGSRYVGINPKEASNEVARANRQSVLHEYCEFFTELTISHGLFTSTRLARNGSTWTNGYVLIL